jgi:hypothetical protein
MKLFLPVEVEIETADSRVTEAGQREYVVGLLLNARADKRNCGCLLDLLRYRFYEGKEFVRGGPLSPWECREQFMHADSVLRQCNAGLGVKKQGRGKATTQVVVRSADTPMHSWAMGIHGVGGSYAFVNGEQDKSRAVRLSTRTEKNLDQECNAWRALIRDALTLDYPKWRQLERRHPQELVRELFIPLPIIVSSHEGGAVARVVCHSLLDVLIVTTQLDGICGLRQRVCKSDRCDQIFPVGNRDKKIFCSYECAHYQAVKDGRRRKRETMKRPAKKPIRRQAA